MRSTLSISGGAVVVLSLWGILKTILVATWGAPSTLEEVSATERAAAEKLSHVLKSLSAEALVALAAALFLLLVASFVLHLYVGINAYREGRGWRHGTHYVAFAVMMAVLGTLSALLGNVTSFALTGSLSSVSGSFVTGMVDLSSVLALADLSRAALRLRRLERFEGRG